MGVAAPDVRSDRRRLFSSRATLGLLAETKTDSSVAVSGIVLVAYVASLIAALAVGHTASSFAFVGQTFLDRSETSGAIEANVDAASAGAGYDGQFSLFIAQDPSRAHAYVDEPSYRYGRIVYPLAARASAAVLGVSVPVTLLALNILAAIGLVLGLGLWLRRRGCSPWPALVVGLYPGIYIAVFRDLADVLAYALVVGAVLVAQRPQRWAIAVSAAIFALAILTRETTVVFALIWAVALVFRGQSGFVWRRGALFATIALLPALVYRGLLIAWFGDPGMPAQLRPSVIPFGGFVQLWPWGVVDALQFTLVLLPGTLCAVVAALALRRGARDPAVVAIAVNAVLYVVMLPKPVFSHFDSSFRAPLGLVVALVLALPALKNTFGAYRLRLFAPAVAPLFAMTFLFAYSQLW